jgi:hypothetical protein
MHPTYEAGTRTWHGFMRFYFGSDEYTAVKLYKTYDTVSFLSNCGGILGLFLGISALSVVEVFYFFVIRVIGDVVRGLRRNTRVYPLVSTRGGTVLSVHGI